MQNKGIIKLFALLFGVVSVYQVSFTFKANQIEKQAQSAAIQKIADSEPDYDSLRKLEGQRYLDSISNQQVYNIGFTSYTYNEVKDRAMNLGLDLKGGVNVVLQISVKDILKGLANNSSNPIFNQALSDAEEIQKNSQNTYLEDFFVAFDAIKGDTKLSDPDIFANRTMSEEITFDMTDEQVRPVLERKIDESIVSAFEVIRKRIDKFGVTQPNIQRLGKSGRILVELPGAKDVERVKKLLQSTAQLEFWETFQGQSFMPFLAQANEVLKSELAESSDDTASTEDAQENVESQLEAALGEVTTDSTAVAEVNPLFDLINGQGYQGGPVIAIFDIKDKQTVTDYLSRPEIKSLLSPEQRFVKFMWGIESPESELIELYAIQGNREGVPELSGAVITDARQSYSNTGKPSVSMQMNAKGAKIWEEMTGKAFNSRGQIAIVLDDIVYSAPGVTTGPISGGNSEISGQFTINEAVDLANVLRAGKLPASADIVQAEEVGPSLGIEAINSGKISFLIALALVVFWMIFYYGRAGIYSNVALLLNILLMYGFLAGLGAVLTLPGIAGIVLTVGIAVDANVLIYERIKEELAKGKGQKQSVSDGFGNALSSIMDANITTALTALILYVFGTGSIKGFATTLLIGIVTSLFTAIFITRFMIDRDNNKGVALKFSTFLTKGLFQNIDVKFLKKRFVMYGVSLTLIIVGLSSLLTRGLDQGIDFVGGRTYQVRFAQDVNAQEVSSALVDVFGSAEVKTIGSPNQLKISTKYMVDENSAEADAKVQSMLFGALKPFLPDGFTEADFIDPSNNVGKVYSGKVSPTIADDIKKSSVWAVLGSLLVVFLYILLRFKKWQFSFGAVVAVFHDVLIVLGIFSLVYPYMPFSMEIDQAFIAAILTVIGYSLNDTVIVFDRIREYLNENTTWDFDRTVDAALSSTLSRTINTSSTTLVVLLAMFAFGTDSLRGLLFALIVGIVVGTYSSIFIASAIMRDTMQRFKK